MDETTEYGYAMPDQTTRYWAAATHAAAIAVIALPPVGGFLGPLLVWFLKRESSHFIDAHGRESINFQLTMLLAGVVLGAAGFVLSFVCLGFVIMALGLLLTMVIVVAVVVATVRALNGEPYRYPLSIRFF